MMITALIVVLGLVVQGESFARIIGGAIPHFRRAIEDGIKLSDCNRANYAQIASEACSMFQPNLTPLLNFSCGFSITPSSQECFVFAQTNRPMIDICRTAVGLACSDLANIARGVANDLHSSHHNENGGTDGSGGSGGTGGGSSSGSTGGNNSGLTDAEAETLGNQAFDIIRDDLRNNNVRITEVTFNSQGQVLFGGFGVGTNANGIITSCMNFMDQANVGKLALNFGYSVSGLGVAFGTAQTFFAFTDGHISLADKLGAISTALNAVGFVCAFIPGGLVISGVLGVASGVLGLVVAVMPNRTAMLIKIVLEDNARIYVYVPAMA